MTSQLLGNPRITEAGYENPDGSPLAVDTDLNGQGFAAGPKAGPLQCLKPGKNVVKLGKYGVSRV